jgi:hypothetical protein
MTLNLDQSRIKFRQAALQRLAIFKDNKVRSLRPPITSPQNIQFTLPHR